MARIYLAGQVVITTVTGLFPEWDVDGKVVSVSAEKLPDRKPDRMVEVQTALPNPSYQSTVFHALDGVKNVRTVQRMLGDKAAIVVVEAEASVLDEVEKLPGVTRLYGTVLFEKVEDVESFLRVQDADRTAEMKTVFKGRGLPFDADAKEFSPWDVVLTQHKKWARAHTKRTIHG